MFNLTKICDHYGHLGVKLGFGGLCRGSGGFKLGFGALCRKSEGEEREGGGSLSLRLAICDAGAPHWSLRFFASAAMKHRHSMRKLGRTSAHRWALLRNLVSQLVQHERIETTVPKAKELRRVADNMVQLGKEGTLAARRRAAGVIHGDDNLHKVFAELALRYKDRAGGYTRVLATRIRQGDSAPMAFIEFVDRPNELRESKPPNPPPPQRVPLPPWLQSRHARCYAPADSGL